MNPPLLRSCIAAWIALLFALPLLAQKSGPPPNPPSQPPAMAPSAPTRTGPAAPQVQYPSYVYGKILTETGVPAPNSTSVKLQCRFQFERAIHPALDGTFQFDLRGGPQSDADMSAAYNPYANQSIVPVGSRGVTPNGQGVSGPLSDCDLRITAPGYQPVSKIVDMRTPDVTGVNMGTVVLTPLLIDPASEVNVNTLTVPKKARTEFEKGERDIRRNDLKTATHHLEKAVSDYDKFAAAWNDLGRVYLSNHQNEKAGQAFSKAIAADPGYVASYLNLAELQIQDGQYANAADTAGKALAVRPGFAPAGFLQALADFKLNRFDAAEQSARLGERGQHQNIPQLHLLLADILLRKSDYSGAAAEMQSYVKEYPNGQFVDDVKSRLAQVDILAAAARDTQPSTETQPQAAPQSTLRAPQQAASNPNATPQPPLATLKLFLRMPDDSPFVGVASVRITPAKGPTTEKEVIGTDGDVTFANLPAESYSIETMAPGFLPIRKQTQIAPGIGTRSIYLLMNPELLSAATVLERSFSSASDGFTNAGRGSWIPGDLDAAAPPVEPGVACPLPKILSGASRHAQEFVQDLQRFDATEHLEQLTAVGKGQLGSRETRSYDYVAIVERSKRGQFTIDEYRNGTVDPSEFPSGIATTGTTAMVLIFHPNLVHDFDFSCEGLGHWDGHPSWQVRFAQRADRPNLIRAYVIARNYYPVPLKGRVWIDAGTYQVRRLEAESLKPTPEIRLLREYLAIDYGRVGFHRNTRQLWLPLDAEIYWERQGHRFYRRHTFSNFKLFEVSFAQEIDPPAQSYCFKNSGSQDVAGVLTVSPISGGATRPAVIHFTIPSGRRVCKLVGPGRDVAIPASDVSSAVFTYDGPARSMTAVATLLNGSTLDLVPESSVVSLTP
jgi:hypothetical protein